MQPVPRKSILSATHFSPYLIFAPIQIYGTIYLLYHIVCRVILGESKYYAKYSNGHVSSPYLYAHYVN